jgi:ABC-type sugar transport system substrate-binding protein
VPSCASELFALCRGAWTGSIKADTRQAGEFVVGDQDGKPRGRLGLLTLVCVAGLVLAGCGASSTSQMGSMVASAAQPDREFLLLMIPHHASAIVMADEEAKDGADPEVKTLSQSIYTDQAAQIGQMQQLLAAGTT